MPDRHDQALRLLPGNPYVWGSLSPESKVAKILQHGTDSDVAALDWTTVEHVLPSIRLEGPYAGLREWLAWFLEERRRRSLAMPDVITPAHRAILRHAADSISKYGFRLGGGTGLAVGYLQHRESDDLDFFTTRKHVFPAALHAFQKGNAHLPQAKVVRSSAFDAELLVGDIRIQLIQTDYPWLQEPDRQVEGVPLVSLTDLAAGKILALHARGDTKDLVDVYLLAQEHFDLSEMLGFADAKTEPAFDRFSLVRSLAAMARAANPAEVRLLRNVDFDAMQVFYQRAMERLVNGIGGPPSRR